MTAIFIGGYYIESEFRSQKSGVRRVMLSLVLVVINTATYAPSAAASAARSDDEGDAGEHRPRRGAPCDEAERRPARARSDPRPARVCDRAPAPPAPGGLAGLCVTSYVSACVWPASRRGRIYEHGYLALD